MGTNNPELSIQQGVEDVLKMTSGATYDPETQHFLRGETGSERPWGNLMYVVLGHDVFNHLREEGHDMDNLEGRMKATLGIIDDARAKRAKDIEVTQRKKAEQYWRAFETPVKGSNR